MMQAMKKIIPILTAPGGMTAYDEAGLTRKRTFHRQARAFLKALAVEVGLQPSQYDLRSNPGGMAVSGEVTLHGEHLYVQAAKSAGRSDILYRYCESRQDYCGGCNRFLNFCDLKEAANFAAFVASCRDLAGVVSRADGSDRLAA